MLTRTCRVCKQEKSLEELTKNKTYKYGREKLCKKCSSDLHLVYYRKNREKEKHKLRESYRLNRESRMAADLKRYRKNKAAIDAQRKERHLSHPEIRRAKDRVKTALRNGSLIKLDCEMCGKSKDEYRIEGHHEDYAKPLEVTWLCTTCHGIKHRK